MKKEISIDGMTCEHCVIHITNALNNLAGVTSIVVDLAQKKATLESNVQDEVLTATIKEAGYIVTGIK